MKIIDTIAEKNKLDLSIAILVYLYVFYDIFYPSTVTKNKLLEFI